MSEPIEPPPLPPSVPLVERWNGLANGGWQTVHRDDWPDGIVPNVTAARDEPGIKFPWRDGDGTRYRYSWSIPDAPTRQDRLDTVGVALAETVAATINTMQAEHPRNGPDVQEGAAEAARGAIPTTAPPNAAVLLRAEIAALIMAAVLPCTAADGPYNVYERVAQKAVRAADALIAELNRTA